MIEFLLAAPNSSSGKTVMTCALLTALKRRGFSPCAFKCGPDYIDPMFHRSVLGVESHNLDLFLAPEETVRRLYAAGTAGHDAAVCEGAMGLYDGVGGGTDRASAWQVAETLEVPVLLVLRPKGASLTLAAQVRGLMGFRLNSHLAGILLNDCSPTLYASFAPMLEQETGLPVLGYLPHTPDAVFESRHLGLCTAGEIRDLSARIDRLAQCAEQTIQLDRLLVSCRSKREAAVERTSGSCVPAARIAVAQDEAFCFTYAETLETLQRAGAELLPFSPLHDTAFPADADGLYLPGGYPELYAGQLSQNETMRRSILNVVSSGLPTVAECGGFLYLGRTLEGADGRSWPQVGALPGSGKKAGRLVRFGYATLTADADSLLLRAGESIPVHEFHYWDSDCNGTDLTAQKPVSGKNWRCGFVNPRLYAAFPHLYLAGQPKLARRFVDAAAAYRREREKKLHGTNE